MLEIKMFKNKYFFYTLIISSLLVICLGTSVLITDPGSMLINYFALVCMALYCIIIKINKRIANILYIFHLLTVYVICILIKLEYIPTILLVLGIPTYIFSEVKLRSVTYRLEKYLGGSDPTYSKRRYFTILIIILISSFIFLIYIADTTDRLIVVYDLIGAWFASFTIYYVYKGNDVSWTFRIAYNTILLLLFYIMRVDTILIIMQLFKIIVSTTCFFEIQYDKEKVRGVREKQNKDNINVSE